MATYKKKGFKRKTKDLDKNQSTTAEVFDTLDQGCLLYTSPSPRD